MFSEQREIYCVMEKIQTCSPKLDNRVSHFLQTAGMPVGVTALPLVEISSIASRRCCRANFLTLCFPVLCTHLLAAAQLQRQILKDV